MWAGVLMASTRSRFGLSDQIAELLSRGRSRCREPKCTRNSWCAIEERLPTTFLASGHSNHAPLQRGRIDGAVTYAAISETPVRCWSGGRPRGQRLQGGEGHAVLALLRSTCESRPRVPHAWPAPPARGLLELDPRVLFEQALISSRSPPPLTPSAERLGQIVGLPDAADDQDRFQCARSSVGPWQ